MLLAFAEVGLFPSVLYLITQWFTLEHRATQTAYSCSADSQHRRCAPGWMLLTVDGIGGLHGSQWRFLIEGLPTCALAFIVWKILPNKPTDAKFLTQEEAEDLEARIAAEEQSAPTLPGTQNYATFSRASRSCSW